MFQQFHFHQAHPHVGENAGTLWLQVERNGVEAILYFSPVMALDLAARLTEYAERARSRTVPPREEQPAESLANA